MPLGQLPRSSSQDKGKRLMRKVFSILFMIAGGFFIYGVSLMSFMSVSDLGLKLMLVLIFAVPAVISITIGLFLSKFKNSFRDVGIVLVSGACFGLLVVIMLVMVMSIEEYKEIVSPKPEIMFNDYGFGTFITGGFIIAGIVLILTNKKELPSDPKEEEVSAFH